MAQQVGSGAAPAASETKATPGGASAMTEADPRQNGTKAGRGAMAGGGAEAGGGAAAQGRRDPRHVGEKLSDKERLSAAVGDDRVGRCMRDQR